MPKRDRTFYPVDDDMGEGSLHREISELVRVLINRFLVAQGTIARVGASQFMYWVQGNPLKTIAPDVYVLPGVPPETAIECWKVWETGIVPTFAVEVVDRAVKKDYADVIARHRELGTSEVIVFDPWAGRGSSRRVRWQIYRRIKGRGLVPVKRSSEDRVRSRQLGCWLRKVGEGNATRVRVAIGPKGDTLVPAEVEAIAEDGARRASARAQAEAASTAATQAWAQAEAASAVAAQAWAQAEAAATVAAQARARAEATAMAEAEARAHAEAAAVASQARAKAAEAEVAKLRKQLAKAAAGKPPRSR